MNSLGEPLSPCLQPLFNPLDAFDHVLEFAVLEEVSDDIVGSVFFVPQSTPHNLPE